MSEHCRLSKMAVDVGQDVEHSSTPETINDKGTHKESRQGLRGTRQDLHVRLEASRPTVAPKQEQPRGKDRRTKERWERRQRTCCQDVHLSPVCMSRCLGSSRTLCNQTLQPSRVTATGKSRGLWKTTYGGGGQDLGAPNSEIHQSEVYVCLTSPGEATCHKKECARVWRMGTDHHRML
ncbi:hypothetical protein NDU88_007081 [Pleurodeles waltl]|uniref:Uncharacterized protein n=1 Tax=Pleurodeles waltl TaxID=8319 RepID=A0AAV7QQU2_PLEWA|nr:hypothetical protein NDU88_007081 [Pleurodeles waltl]